MSDRFNQNKPDDRSDNAEKLQSMVHDTIENFREAEETMEYSSGEQKKQIRAKNNRRKEAIDEMRSEIKDESRYQK